MVVTVAGLDVPAERTQLGLEIAQGEDLLRGFVGLKLVPVDDDPEVVSPLSSGSLQRLEVLSFLQLSVARHYDDAPAATEQALCPCHAAALGDAHPQRAGVRLDPRHAEVGMTV